ncbi:NAD(P)H-hydrate dehydratase [Sphingomonas sp. MMS12-HWE2-04]|uniref:NAD(P)H-hydrate dehydratase n=1 Tax=Sphingomonas sp. MMS12-HWE2-04 TaxID=3234199 RepID=UPI00384C1F0C
MTGIDAAWRAANPLPEPDADTDKNSRGRVLAAGGSLTVPGALRLTGEAALRAGAGKVQLATVTLATLPLGIAMPEAAVYALPANAAGELADAAGETLCGYLERCDALVLGPGMGAEAGAEAILRPVLAAAGAHQSIVLDAAAIPAVAAMPDAVRRQGRIILTPHAGEMARLMDCDEQEAKRNPEALARSAADRFGAVVLLKGAETWIAAPDGSMLHYPGGGHGLATGGSGDILAGIIAGLLSRGAAPLTASAWGVWLHGEAGRACANRIGPMGFLARELLPEIPGLMAV